MHNKRFRVLAGIVILAVLATGAAVLFTRANQAKADAGGMPRFQHIFYIMMENQAYDEIIGNANTPHINALASEYGLATQYFGVTHPSEPNYVASVGGDVYINDTTVSLSPDFSGDNAYYCYPISTASVCSGTTESHSIHAPYLGSQLEDAHLSWKTYQQSMPSAGFTGANYPAGYVSGGVKLYASKHNPFLNFLAYYGPAPTSPDAADGGSWTPNAAQQAELSKEVPLDDASVGFVADLNSGNVPNFSYIVPDQCHDMHGIGGYTSSDGVNCGNNIALFKAGDAYVNTLVSEIQSSNVWKQGNNAIVITWDENDFTAADCPPADVTVATLGCQVPTIVIANHGPHHVQYDMPANHYSLLLTIEDAFGLGCLNQACPDSGSNVKPMTPLFANGDN
jgi:hypothetical protein